MSLAVPGRLCSYSEYYSNNSTAQHTKAHLFIPMFLIFLIFLIRVVLRDRYLLLDRRLVLYIIITHYSNDVQTQ